MKRRAAPRPSRRETSTRARPSPALVTSEDAENLARLRAKIARAERILRKTGKPWAALAKLEITESRPGRRTVSIEALEDLAGRYINMRTWPRPGDPPERVAYFRTHGSKGGPNLDLLQEYAADVIAAQREGRTIPPTPAELVFVPDCDNPMSREDALRNVAAYRGVSPRQAWELLSRAERDCSDLLERNGLPDLDLPSRPN